MTSITNNSVTPNSTNKFSYNNNWLLAGTVLMLWLGLFYSEVSSTAAIWLSSDTYAHGLFILPLSAWMYWRRKDEFLAITAKPSFIAAIVSIALSLLWFVAQLMEINSLIHLLTFMILSSLLWLVLGDEFLRKFQFPLVYILFCAPFGNSLIPYLQDITAQITVFLLQLSQIPVFFEGLYITVPSGVFEVAVACSGIRYLIACFAIGSLYAHLSYTHWRKKLIFILFSLAFPILANGVRAYLVVLIAYLSDMKYATGVDHLIYGWLFFGLVIYLMFSIGNIWADVPVETDKTAANSSVITISTTRALVVVLTLITIATAVIKIATLPQSAVPKLPFQVPAHNMAQHQPNYASDWQFKLEHALSIYRGYSSSKVEVLTAKFGHKQSQGKLITSTNVIFDPERWSLQSSRSAALKIQEKVINYSQLVLVSVDGRHRFLRYWYTVDGEHYASRWETKLAQGVAQVLNTSNHGNLNALSFEYSVENNGQQLANATLDQWMVTHAVAFAQVLNE